MIDTKSVNGTICVLLKANTKKYSIHKADKLAWCGAKNAETQINSFE